MKKVPVGTVVSDTWVFLFSEFETLIRFAWFPLFVSVLIQVGIGYLSSDALALALANLPALDRLLPVPMDDAMTIGLDLVGNLVNLVAVTIVTVAIYRLILYDDHRPGRYFLLSFRKPEFLFVCFAILIGICGFLALTAMTAVRENAPDVVEGDWAIWAAAATLAAVGLFLIVRLLPLYPIMVAERRMDFGLAFHLSRRNFWRLLGVLVSGMIIPSAIVGAVFAFVVIPFVLAPVSSAISTGLAGMFAGAGVDVPGLISVGFAVLGFLLTAIAAMSLFVALVSYSYKALRGLGPYQYLSEDGSA
ncbi:MAG: hypothetical protein GY798_10750 [Hyphomicrobiales bacterium]|nr:hypothetical protein [Hyphomicrobiales bacterium]